ncbi:FAD dependent oxidoreductase domain protein [Mycobacterium xenopi 4042]|uniref:FAD dependent oxidoreductase domain protein n=1 Tax=Mycobacterium xenopi 4042 TaxID=1299334 RepID=X7Z4Q6_MYCXE|nr:FAD dependent oxidoreductase domain protein [Mycobacterium xenopi 4042]
MLRALDVLPKSGTRRPWVVSHDFLRDVVDHRLRPIDDQMVFGRVPAAEAQPA